MGKSFYFINGRAVEFLIIYFKFPEVNVFVVTLNHQHQRNYLILIVVTNVLVNQSKYVEDILPLIFMKQEYQVRFKLENKLEEIDFFI